MTQEEKKKKGNVLVVTNQQTQGLLDQAFNLLGRPQNLLTINNGNALLDYLSIHKLPDIVLLDHQPPGLDAVQLLQPLKSHPGFKSIPVIVWSHSASQKEIIDFYQAGANCFIEVSDDWNDLVFKVKLVYEYWFETALLPNKNLFSLQ